MYLMVPTRIEIHSIGEEAALGGATSPHLRKTQVGTPRFSKSTTSILVSLRTSTIKNIDSLLSFSELHSLRMANPTVIAFKDDITSIDGSLLPPDSIVFTNCRLCILGHLTHPNSVLIASESTGKILDVLWKKPTYVSPAKGVKVVDLGNKILAPGFLELQTNGMTGFHFTHFEEEKRYAQNLEEVATYLPSQGVTGFWVTLPTIKSEEFQKVRLARHLSDQV